MGLAIIKKTVESVNGTVTLESDGRQGCVFRFTWPADIAAVVSERDAVLA
jgi:signal transduction histidine kinase